MVSNDRRRLQRLKLAKPILAMMETHSALILDIGMLGAYIEHYGLVHDGDRFPLAFRWQGEDVSFICEVVRTDVVRESLGAGQTSVCQTGVTFVEAIGNSAARLAEMRATFVGRVLAAQKANAAADVEGGGGEVLFQMGQARRSRSHGYHTYRWDGRKWSSARTSSPIQPPDGFTVAAYEDEEELQTLCRTYERSDEEARNLIRLVAELSAKNARR